MTCKHDAIKTWRTDDGTPVMWSCVDCSRKFEPLIVPAAQIHTSVYPEYTPPQQQAEPVAWIAEVELSVFARTPKEKTTVEIWKKPVLDSDVAIYTAQPQRKPLTEAQQVDCLVKSGCIGTVKMSFESGPYDITRPSINASMLIEAVEAAHGIKEGT